MKDKKFLLVLAAVVVIIAGFLVVNIQPNRKNIIGGDKDEGGCLVGAGYSWCKEKNKCVRVWEEPCTTEDKIRVFLNENLSTLSPKKEELGGKFYVTKVIVRSEDEAEVEYEDGHVAYKGLFKFKLDGDTVTPVSFDNI